MLDAAEIYVGVLAATILFIATNAGVIGASRITYSMASYRQLPEVLRRLHPRFKTPWLSLVIFAGIAPILVILPGDVNFVGTLYSLGATLSFTIAHAAIVRLRMTDRGRTRARSCTGRARTCGSAGDAGRSSRSLGGIATGRLVPRPRRPEPGHALGGARLDGGRARRLRRLPAALGEGAAERGREGAARARAGARARVPAHPRAGRRRPALRRGARRRVPPGGEAVARRRAERPRGAARSAARSRVRRAGAGGEPGARRGGRDRRLVRRRRDEPLRARAGGRPGDRRGGGGAQHRDHRPRLSARPPDGTPGRRLRRRRSTTSSSTRPAVSSPSRRGRHEARTG